MTRPAPYPLRGTTVLDVSRMLPGGITARMLADLGARVIKVEAPEVGDPMRFAVPRVDGIGAAFRALYRGTESMCLDLKRAGDAAALRSLAREADVLLESFRPGTLESWGVDLDELLSVHPGLTICSLSSFGLEAGDRVAHDINLVASSGLLSLLPGERVPRVQVADVATGLLATSAILAALLGRAESGRGGWIDQPLSAGCPPFLALALEEHAAGGGGMADTLLAGACPAYRFYECADGKRIAVGAIEPKFWARLVELLGLPALSAVGLDSGVAGREAARQVEQVFATRPREHWLARLAGRGLPVSPVAELAEVAAESRPEAFLPSFGSAAEHRTPELGEHTSSILAEFGIETD